MFFVQHQTAPTETRHHKRFRQGARMRVHRHRLAWTHMGPNSSLTSTQRGYNMVQPYNGTTTKKATNPRLQEQRVSNCTIPCFQSAKGDGAPSNLPSCVRCEDSEAGTQGHSLRSSAHLLRKPMDRFPSLLFVQFQSCPVSPPSLIGRPPLHDFPEKIVRAASGWWNPSSVVVAKFPWNPIKSFICLVNNLYDSCVLVLQNPTHNNVCLNSTSRNKAFPHIIAELRGVRTSLGAPCYVQSHSPWHWKNSSGALGRPRRTMDPIDPSGSCGRGGSAVGARVLKHWGITGIPIPLGGLVKAGYPPIIQVMNDQTTVLKPMLTWGWPILRNLPVQSDGP